MAERYLRTYGPEEGVNSLAVRSAGFVPTEGRPSPELAVETASAYGVDLSSHRSKAVTTELLDWSDVVFVMDVDNYHRLRNHDRDVLDRTYFLNALNDGGRFEVDDPYRGDSRAYGDAYADIAGAVDRLLDILEDRD